MRKKYEQMALTDIYSDVAANLEENKPLLLRRLDEHIDWEAIIPWQFYNTFYRMTGRPRGYSLEGFIKMLVLQKILGYVDDSLLLNTLRLCREMRDFCGFDKVPDASKLTRFKQDFLPYIVQTFERLVELTEPICREMDPELADSLIFDLTGIESYVAENNPKFLSTKLDQAKSLAKINPAFDPYKGVYTLLPDCAEANPAVKQQYINGHFCYAQKAGILTNALGIVRHLDLLDEDFKAAHPEMQIDKRTDNPGLDKEIGDAKALMPNLNDFRAAHPSLSYSTFLGDSSFDSYELYDKLLGEYGFERAVIPMNIRNSSASSPVDFNEHGIPLCPNDKSPMIYMGICKGKNRSPRLKFHCPKSVRSDSAYVCSCETPCSSSAYGRCVYVYPNKDRRLYPGIARDSQEWNDLYKKRATVERSIGSFKTVLGLQHRKTFNSVTTKADLFLAGIVQLLCVILADKLHNLKLFRSVRKFIA